MDSFHQHLTSKGHCTCSDSSRITTEPRTQTLGLGALLGDQGQDLGKPETGLTMVREKQEGSGSCRSPFCHSKRVSLLTMVLFSAQAPMNPILKNKCSWHWWVLPEPTATLVSHRDSQAIRGSIHPNGTSAAALPPWVRQMLSQTDGHRLQDPANWRETIFENFDNQRGGTSASI